MKRFILLLSAFALLSCSATMPPKKAMCPTVQAGVTDAVQLSATGETIVGFALPCAYPVMPVLVVSPTGQGSGDVMRFESNPLTGGEMSIAVYGTPSAWVRFQWVATMPTP